MSCRDLIPNSERRLSPRYTVNMPAEFFGLAGAVSKSLFSHVCVLVDVSATGARIRSTTKYKVNGRVTLSVSLYDKAGRIDLRGRVLRVTKLPSGWYEYGIRFEHLSDQQISKLTQDLAYIARVK